jgi:hypothetical protein
VSRQTDAGIRLPGQGDWSAQSPRSAQITQGLFKAVMAEDLNELQRLLAQGGSWNALNAKGQTLEEVARERGRQKMVRYFERRSAVMAEQEKMRLSRIHERSMAKTLYASSSPIAVRHGRTLATGGGGVSPLGRGRGGARGGGGGGGGGGAEQFWRRAAATAVLHQPEVDECVQAGEVDAGSGACACACRRRRLLCCVCVCVLCVCVCASLARPGPGGAHCEPTPLPPTALACWRSLMATAHPPEPLSCL